MEQQPLIQDMQPAAYGRWERVQHCMRAIGVTDTPDYVYDRNTCIGDTGPFGGSEDLPASMWPDSDHFDADRAAASFARRMAKHNAALANLSS